MTSRFCAALGLMLTLAATTGGCSSISTPLPDIGPTGSVAMSPKDSKAAVKELSHRRDTHQQEAEREIEQSK